MWSGIGPEHHTEASHAIPSDNAHFDTVVASSGNHGADARERKEYMRDPLFGYFQNRTKGQRNEFQMRPNSVKALLRNTGKDLVGRYCFANLNEGMTYVPGLDYHAPLRLMDFMALEIPKSITDRGTLDDALGRPHCTSSY